MKLPRDISGTELAALLSRHGYEITRQTGSHLRLTSTRKDAEHHVTIPAHRALRTGTLSGILAAVASYLDVSKDELSRSLFEE